VAVVLLAASLLTACSDEQDSYCDALEGAQQELTDLADQAGAEGDGEAVNTLTPTLDILQGLREAAPDELGDEWDTLVFAYEALAEAVEEAGIDPAGLEAGDGAGDLPPEQRRELRSLASKLLSARVLAASQGIEDHAREVCDVEFDA